MNSWMSIVTGILGVGVSLYRVLVFMFLYNWFIVTVFGLPEISFWISFILIMTLNILFSNQTHRSLIHYAINNIKKEEAWVYDLGYIFGNFVAYSLMWLIGWIIYLNI